MSSHYGDLRAHATQWWALQRARIRLELTVGAAKKAGWSTPTDPLSLSLKAIRAQERIAARATVAAAADVYPAIAALVGETTGLGDAIALFIGLLPPLRRLEDFPGFPCPTALWTYCGLVAKKRAKFDRRARTIAIAYIGTPAILRSETYHALYAARRERTADRGWTKMHAHRDGIRFVAKRILLEIWHRRLSVGSPVLVLSPEASLTAAGGAPSVSQPTNMLRTRGNALEGALPASESDPFPQDSLAPEVSVSASEPVAPPSRALMPVPAVTAPEFASPSQDTFLPSLPLSAPEPVVASKAHLSPFLEVTAPESVASSKVHLSPDLDVTAPEPA